MTEKYSNKRLRLRGHGGKFRKANLGDFGLTGVCPTCRHFLFKVYDGDPRDPFPDPRKFRSRCLTCEPYTEAELTLQAEIEASKPKPPSLMDLLNRGTSNEK